MSVNARSLKENQHGALQCQHPRKGRNGVVGPCGETKFYIENDNRPGFCLSITEQNRPQIMGDDGNPEPLSGVVTCYGCESHYDKDNRVVPWRGSDCDRE